MADGYDRYDTGESGGGSFMMGLLTGTVIGAGLGMLFAPKSGSELRNQISEQAGNFADTASDGWRRANDAAGDLANRGRQIYEKTRDAVSRGADEARRYVSEATEEQELTGHQMATGTGGMSHSPSSHSPSSSSSHTSSTRSSYSSSSTKPGGSQSGSSRS